MDLLKYLTPMKNLPKRFSNLAFWRDVRKFKDEAVNAFEYINSWGTSVEETEKKLREMISAKSAFSLLNTISLTTNMFTSLSVINNTNLLLINDPPSITTIPKDCKFAIVYAVIECKIDSHVYTFTPLWCTPVISGNIIFPQTYTLCDSNISVTSTPTFSIVQGSCWCYG